MKHTTATLVAMMFLICTADLHAEEGLKAGTTAPAFTLPAVGTEQTVSLQSYAGRSVVILHFWKSK